MEAANMNWEDKISNIIEKSKDKKAFLEKINILKGRTTKYTNYLEDKDGQRYYTNKEKCNLMEKSWRDIFRITAEEDAAFDQTHSQHIQAYLNIHKDRIKPYDKSGLNRLNDKCYYTRPVNKEELIKYFNRTKNKAPECSRINKKVLEKCTEKAITVIPNLFNACFSAGLFPSAFKTAIIRFIPKEGKIPKDPMNYRPISLLETPGKLMEKIIQERFNAYLNDHNIIIDRQHGFRPKKGITTAIALTYETITNALSEKHQVLVVLRDVAKAFDKVWHSGLKYKLLQLGIPYLLEKVLCTFLDNRRARISTDNEISNNINLLSGVPQGSVLSVTLYTLYTNDLPNT